MTVQPKTWLWVLAVLALGCAVTALFLGIGLAGTRGELDEERARAEEADSEIDDLSDQLAELEEELDDTQQELRRSQRELKEATEEPAPAVDLAEALANGTAESDPDLSADSPPKFFHCENRSCSALSQEYVFKNDSQVGTAITCVFEVEYDNGGVATFRWAVEYVEPGGGTFTDRVFFFGARPIEYLSDPEEDDCYRGFAP